MRRLLPVVVLVFSSAVVAQEKTPAKKPATTAKKPTAKVADDPNRHMLHDYLLAECEKHFAVRRELLMKLEKPDDLRKRQAELKAKFIEALGGFPEKTPLKAKTVGAFQADGFRVEKVVFESRPEHHVTGNLFIPEGKGPFPGVIIPCGHSVNGKAAEAYQRIAILLAKNGMVSFCYDPIGQGERLQLPVVAGKPAIAGSTAEHSLIGIGALLVGESCATYRIWDGLRAMDYLADRPEVDAKRLGCTGNSGGGTLTAYLMALDDRIVAAAPSCYITTLDRLFHTLGPQDAEQNITGQVAFGMDHGDYVMMRAPRPTLICTGTQDFFDITGSWTAFREASLFYGKLGYGERVSLFEFNDKHGFSKPRREAAARWMSRWLLGKDEPIFESNFPSFKDAALQVTRSGQVLEDFKGVSAFQLNAQRSRKFAAARAKFVDSPQAEQQATIRKLLAIPDQVPAARQTEKRLLHIEDRFSTLRLTFETDPGVKVHAIRYRHLAPMKPTAVVLSDRGMPSDKSIPAEWKEFYEKHHEVIFVDVRGLGVTSPGPIADKPGQFGVDSKHAFLSLHLNRPLLGQRVFDVLSVLKTLGAEEVHLVGEGVAGPAALHAAALEPTVTEVAIRQSLGAWSDVAETPLTVNQLSSVVPGVLKHYDLPELVASLAPRPVVLRSMLSARYQPASDGVVSLYDAARRRYEQTGAKGKLVLER